MRLLTFILKKIRCRVFQITFRAALPILPCREPEAALITDSDTQHKYALMSFPLIPRYAVLDASLTYTLPPHMTSTMGMDALTHATEAYIGCSTSRETRRLALEAVKLVFENVEKAYAGQSAEHHVGGTHTVLATGQELSQWIREAGR